MSYDFKNLSSADFEDLVRDLIGREETLRFEHSAQGRMAALMAGTRRLMVTSFYRRSIMKVRRSVS